MCTILLQIVGMNYVYNLGRINDPNILCSPHKRDIIHITDSSSICNIYNI